MAQDHEPLHPNPPPTNLVAAVWHPTRHRIPLRRRKIPTIRLGGKKTRRVPVLTLAKMFRRVRLRWLKLQYLCMLRKLKEYYKNMVKDLMEAGATLESFQQKVLMETALAVPVLGVTFNGYPSVA